MERSKQNSDSIMHATITMDIFPEESSKKIVGVTLATNDLLEPDISLLNDNGNKIVKCTHACVHTSVFTNIYSIEFY